MRISRIGRVFFSLLACLGVAGPAYAQGTIAPFPYHAFYDNNGNPCNGCKLFTYVAGSSTKASVFTNVSLSVAHSNPLVLTSAGRPTSPIFLGAASFKFVLAPANDTDPPSSPIWTVDNVSAVPQTLPQMAVTGTAGEALGEFQFVYLSDGSGGRTAGRWYLTDADFTYASTDPHLLGIIPDNGTLVTGESGPIMVAGRITGVSGLTAGQAYYISATAGSATSSAPTNARIITQADSTTSHVLTTWRPVPDATGTVAGSVNITAQSFEGVKTFQDPPLFWAGGLTNNTARVSGRHGAFTTYTNIGNVGAGEDNLHSFSMLGNTLIEDGQVLRLTAWGTYAANANSKQVRCYFGATVVANGGAAATNGGSWRADVTVIRTGAATQRVSATFLANDGAGVLASASITTSAPTETLSGAVTVKCTGTGVANDDIIQSAFIPEIVG